MKIYSCSQISIRNMKRNSSESKPTLLFLYFCTLCGEVVKTAMILSAEDWLSDVIMGASSDVVVFINNSIVDP